MIDLPCLCGNTGDVTVVFEQNFSEEMLSPSNFSARGRHDLEREHLHYRIVRCNRCSQLFSSPILDPDAIGRFYQASSLDYAREYDNIVKAYFQPLRKWARLLDGMSATLEIGCGSGFCLDALRSLGFTRLVGIEPSAHAVAQAKDHIRPFILNIGFEHAVFDDESFDLVCAFQVLDHFIDPVKVMKTAYRILKPQSLCYVIIHNERALQVRLLGDKSPIIDVSHIYYFNPTTLRRIFEDNGFKVIDTFPIWNAYTLKTWLTMAPFPLKKDLMKIIALLGADGIPISVPAGNIGIIGQKAE